MRMRLVDRACVCIISSRIEETGLRLWARCTTESKALGQNPLTLILWLFEDRADINIRWLYDNWNEVGKLESSTGMLPPTWLRATVAPGPESSGLEIRDYKSLLQDLHAVNVELLLAQSIMAFVRQLGVFCLETLEVTENLRDGLGLSTLKPGVRAVFEEQTVFKKEICLHCSEKFDELLARVQVQINVVRSWESLIALQLKLEQTFSLIAQQDSSVNLFLAGDSRRIAMWAVRDSQTMKTITVITLVFLPSTLVSVSQKFLLDCQILLTHIVYLEC
jgi:hypothetical protein